MTNTIDLNKLRIFREVVLAGSFSKAALNLKQPKSRISRVISSLEKELGLQLIYRTTRQFHLTQAGTELFNRISPLMLELKKSIEQVASESDETSGLIKVTVPDDIGTELLGQLCHEFMEIYPKIQIGVHASNDIVDLVKNSVDISIRIGRIKDSTMIQKKIGHIEMIFVMSPLLFQKYQPRRLKDLEKIPFLAFEAFDLKTHFVKITNGKEKLKFKFIPRFGSNNFFVLRSMVLRGTGVALLPVFMVKRFLESGELVQVTKDWKVEGLPIQILIPQQKEIPPKIRKFIDYIAPRLEKYF